MLGFLIAPNRKLGRKFSWVLICALISPITHAQTQTYGNSSVAVASQSELLDQLYTELDQGDIFAGDFDKDSELQIGRTELQLARSYLDNGDRKLAIILGVQARKTMQRALGDPYSPQMIPVYSILVQLYDGVFDKSSPNAASADPAKAKMYRQAIDHIHAR